MGIWISMRRRYPRDGAPRCLCPGGVDLSGATQGTGHQGASALVARTHLDTGAHLAQPAMRRGRLSTLSAEAFWDDHLLTTIDAWGEMCAAIKCTEIHHPPQKNGDSQHVHAVPKRSGPAPGIAIATSARARANANTAATAAVTGSTRHAHNHHASRAHDPGLRAAGPVRRRTPPAVAELP